MTIIVFSFVGKSIARSNRSSLSFHRFPCGTGRRRGYTFAADALAKVKIWVPEVVPSGNLT